MKKLMICVCLFAVVATGFTKEHHVSVTGSDKNTGSLLKPFQTINYAARVAAPGDTVTVYAGTYREWVNPARGGNSEAERIVYRAASGETVKIKGSEIVTNWTKEKEGTWKVTIPNSFFGTYNSCADLVYGDWCDNFGKVHTADVFLNEESLYEVENKDKVLNPTSCKNCNDKEGSIYTWYCESDSNNTTIWANFHSYNPNKELVELSIRRTCFYPEKPGLNYITISGFHFSQAATQWAPPTAEQVGMVATHWNKGWIIENCKIHDSKCAGITMGKERETGQNEFSAEPWKDNSGAIQSIEVIFRVLRNGWKKENIGSHIVRNNVIYNCEQAGICGNFGAAFSVIENNHIYNINQKGQLGGFEQAGIKFHAAIDTKIEKNRIHDINAFGCWFDWEAQGTRVSKNLIYNTTFDLVFEVNHGPFLVDNNILLSNSAIVSGSEGGAYVHNLIAGTIQTWAELSRFTPYHLPHSTDIVGLAKIFIGDVRYFNNIFLGSGPELDKKDTRFNYGLVGYNDATLPVSSGGNIFYNKALPSKYECNSIQNSAAKPEFKIVEEEGSVFLVYSIDESYSVPKTQMVTTVLLGKTKMAKEGYENPDGSPLKIDTDYLGNKRSEYNPSSGPFEKVDKGTIKVKVW